VNYLGEPLETETRSMHQPIRIPADWEPHKCCWMAWAVDRRDWENTNKVKRELSEVIQTIARYEPVYVLARPGTEYREAKREFAACRDVAVFATPVDDIWMRDIAPTFAWSGRGTARKVVAIDWNFNTWGNTRHRPWRAGDRLARTASSIFGVPRISAAFVAEGGAFVTDGQGTMITTRSCLLNANRNPVCQGLDRAGMIEMGLARLGVNRVIWLEGDSCEPLTSGHADGYILCAPSRAVLVETYDDKEIEPPMWRGQDLSILEHATSADGRPFKVTQLHAPRRRYWTSTADTFAPCYLNVYVANGAVIGARFGDPQRDEIAKRALSKAFIGREIKMIRIDHIAEGGGGIRCITQPMPGATSD
jgi:agmatine deiminase